MWDLKAALMEVQCSLIQENMLYKFELDHKATEATKNICYVKGEGTVDQSSEGLRNFTQVVRTSVFQATEANLANNTKTASGKLGIT